MATLVQTLPGIRMTEPLSQEKNKQCYFSEMSIKTTMGPTDAKPKATKEQGMKQQLN